MSLNILFTSAGRRVSLLEQFRRELEQIDAGGRIVSADLRRDAPAHHVAHENVLLPEVSSDGYVDALRRACRDYEVGLVIPLIDTELPVLAAHRQEFADLGVCLLVSGPDTIALGANKCLTHRFFADNGFDAPKLFEASELAEPQDLPYPLMLKPAAGSSGKGLFLIQNAFELDFFRSYVDDAMVQECVRGREFTLDVLADFEGTVRCVVPRERLAIRAGEVSKGVTVRNERVISLGASVVEALPDPLGCITVQCFLTESGDVKFIEINPRFGGGFPLAYQAGANFPRWLLEMYLGREPHIGQWQDGLAMLRYDAAVFVGIDAIT